LNVSGDELEYHAGDWQFRTLGDARATLARPVSDYVGDPLAASRFDADEIRRDGETITLRGNARLRLPNWAVSAEYAVVDRAAGTVTIKGDATFAALKSILTDDLGPMFITNPPLNAGPGGPSVNHDR